MFVVDEGGALRRIKRRPANWDALSCRGWLFLPENREWDASGRDAVIASIDELYALADLLDTFSDAWLKRRAAEYCRSKRITLTADPDPPRRPRKTRRKTLGMAARRLSAE